MRQVLLLVKAGGISYEAALNFSGQEALEWLECVWEVESELAQK